MSCVIDFSKVELFAYTVSVGGSTYSLQAPSLSSAIRTALYVYLDVPHWEQEMQEWFSCTKLGDILATMPDCVSVYGIKGGGDENEENDVDDDCRLLQ